MGHRPGEHAEIVREGHLLRLAAQRGGAVLQRDDVEPAFIGAAHGRLHTAIGEEAAEHHRPDALAAQDEIEVGRGKRVQPALAFDQDIAGLRLQHVDDVGAPAALAKGLVVDDALQDAVGIAGQFAVAFGKGDRRMHDGDARLARSGDDRDRVAEHVVGLHDILDPVMKDALRRGKIVLVLDQDNRRGSWIHRKTSLCVLQHPADAANPSGCNIAAGNNGLLRTRRPDRKGLAARRSREYRRVSLPLGRRGTHVQDLHRRRSGPLRDQHPIDAAARRGHQHPAGEPVLAGAERDRQA